MLNIIKFEFRKPNFFLEYFLKTYFCHFLNKKMVMKTDFSLSLNKKTLGKL